MNRVGYGLLLAGAVAGALYFLFSNEPRAHRKEPTGPEAAPPARTNRRTADAPTPETKPVAPSTPGSLPEDRVSLGESRKEPEPVPLDINGTIVVLDEFSNEHREESGFLALALGPENARRHLDVLVRKGRWSANVAARPLRFRSCRLGNRTTALAPGQPAELTIPPDARVELRLRWLAGPLLHVRARDSKLELEDVTLCELPLILRGSPADALHPGPLSKTSSRVVGPSPIRLETLEHDWADSRVLFAKSPGYAWGRIEIEEGNQEKTLWLDPSGALELEVVGAPQFSTMEILLLGKEPPHEEVLDVVRGTARSFVFEDLRAGRYVAQARSYGVVAGSLEVEVSSGERVKAVLDVLDVIPPGPGTVPLEGVLVMPEEWSERYETKDFSCDFMLLGRFDDGGVGSGLSEDSLSFSIRRSEMVPEKGSRERFRWSAVVAPARYRVSLFPARFETELDTGPTGTRDALIEVPPPCRISVRCIDEESGAEVSSEPVSFSALTPRAFGAATFGTVDGGLPQVREFDLPQGRGLIFTKSVLYPSVARVVDVAPGRNEVLLPLRKKL